MSKKEAKEIESIIESMTEEIKQLMTLNKGKLSTTEEDILYTLNSRLDGYKEQDINDIMFQIVQKLMIDNIEVIFLNEDLESEYGSNYMTDEEIENNILIDGDSEFEDFEDFNEELEDIENFDELEDLEMNIDDTDETLTGLAKDIKNHNFTKVKSDGFFAGVENYPVLTREQEYDLFTELRELESMEQDIFTEERIEEIKYHLCMSNKKLVAKIASRYVNAQFTTEDMRSWGMIGLIKAIDKFDVTRGFKLSTFAQRWIKAPITRAKFNEGKVVRIPVHIGQKINTINKHLNTLKVQGEEATLERVAEIMEEPIEDIKWAYSHSKDIQFLESKAGEDGTLEDYISSSDKNATEEMFEKDRNNQVNLSLRSIPTDDELIIRLSTGIYNFEYDFIYSDINYLKSLQNKVQRGKDGSEYISFTSMKRQIQQRKNFAPRYRTHLINNLEHLSKLESDINMATGDTLEEYQEYQEGLDSIWKICNFFIEKENSQIQIYEKVRETTDNLSRKLSTNEIATVLSTKEKPVTSRSIKPREHDARNKLTRILKNNSFDSFIGSGDCTQYLICTETTDSNSDYETFIVMADTYSQLQKVFNDYLKVEDRVYNSIKNIYNVDVTPIHTEIVMDKFKNPKVTVDVEIEGVKRTFKITIANTSDIKNFKNLETFKDSFQPLFKVKKEIMK